jgi:3-oxoacyl-[acyl-carrier protein] reductase
MNRLKDKIAVITGSARGIGFIIAKTFAEEGAKVIILDINQELVNNAVEEIAKITQDVIGFVTDVTNQEMVANTIKEIIKSYKKIDILVNNAGITKDGLLMKMKESDWDAVINVNLKGTFLCTQKVIRHMLKQRSGSIINISSVIGIMGNAGQANYAASKGGIISLTKSSAKEFASRNIRVNAVAPGFIETEMTAKLSEEVIKEYAKSIPLNRMGKPEDVAKLCLFLASDDSSYITGQVIKVDGGLVND